MGTEILPQDSRVFLKLLNLKKIEAPRVSTRGASRGEIFNPKDICTAAEIATYLRIHPYTVKRLARGGKPPGFRVGGQWRYNRHQIGILTNKPTKKHKV